MADEGFLARWSRRKAAATGNVEPAVAPRPGPACDPSAEANVPSLGDAALAQTDPTPSPPPPTLADVAHLTPQSDFRRFVAPTVDPLVKNAALKKLFADPHFNVMDGLDVYIDDYGKASPIPAAMLRQLVQAQGLGLFDQEPADDQASPDGAASEGRPKSAQDATAVPPDENPDLRLQQDDAAGCGDAEERPPA